MKVYLISFFGKYIQSNAFLLGKRIFRVIVYVMKMFFELIPIQYINIDNSIDI